MRVRFVAVLVLCVAVAASGKASPTLIGANADIGAAREACWELAKPIPSIWRLRIASGHFDARPEGKLWHVRLIEPPSAPKCPVDGNTVTCTVMPCYTKS